MLSYLSLVLDSLSLIIDFSFVAESPDDVCGYCVFHGAAGWSHFAQFTIAVVNKDPKKSKYSGNVAITEPSKIMAVDDCGWLWMLWRMAPD